MSKEWKDPPRKWEGDTRELWEMDTGWMVENLGHQGKGCLFYFGGSTEVCISQRWLLDGSLTSGVQERKPGQQWVWAGGCLGVQAGGVAAWTRTVMDGKWQRCEHGCGRTVGRLFAVGGERKWIKMTGVERLRPKDSGIVSSKGESQMQGNGRRQNPLSGGLGEIWKTDQLRWKIDYMVFISVRRWKLLAFVPRERCNQQIRRQ